MSALFSHQRFRGVMMAGAMIGGIALALGTSASPAQAQTHLAQYYSPYYAPPYPYPPPYRPYYRYGYPGYRGWYRPRWYGGGYGYGVVSRGANDDSR